MASEDFKEFIQEAYKNRQAQIVKKQDLEVKALPEFVELFKTTRTVSHKTYYLHHYI